MVKEKLLAVRKQIKSRKPSFRRSQVNQFAKLRNNDAWRKPKGMGNKIRRNRRGQPSMPTVGYGSPSEVRGLGPLGLKEVIVSNLNDLKNINVKEEIIVISRRVGSKKKLELLKEIKSKKLSVANVKNIDDAIKALTKEKTQVKKSEPKKAGTEKKVESKKESKTDKKEANKK